jgi:plastocyanin
VPAQYIHGNAASTAYGATQTHRVDVGNIEGRSQFVPNHVNADIGDVVEFNFLATNHSLTQSEFLTPCTYNGGFDTGFNQPNGKNESGKFVIPFEVTTEKPQWFYCKQTSKIFNHCNAGMVFGLNPGDKMDQFIQNARNQDLTVDDTADVPRPNSDSPTTTATAPVATVTVGLENGSVLKFDPPYLPKVLVGQTVHFDFRAVNHTLTESSLENPCKKLPDPGAIDTNFQNVNREDIPEFKPFDLTIDSDKPRFFYCRQANGTPNGHCSKGMIFSVNTDAATFNLFEQNALATLPKIKGRVAA